MGNLRIRYGPARRAATDLRKCNEKFQKRRNNTNEFILERCKNKKNSKMTNSSRRDFEDTPIFFDADRKSKQR